MSADRPRRSSRIATGYAPASTFTSTAEPHQPKNLNVPRPTKPKDAPVKAFAGGAYASNVNGSESNVSKSATTNRRRGQGGRDRMNLSQAEMHARRWLDNRPTYIVKGVKLSELEARAKNSTLDKATAQATVELMKGAKADACSANFIDEDQKTLASIFSYTIRREKTATVSSEKPGYYPGPDGRTFEEVLKLPKDAYFYDGIPARPLTRIHAGTQDLAADVPPCVHPRDQRHPDTPIMEYPREGVELSRTSEYERAGVLHLVHAWLQQGHPNGRLTPSADMTGRTCSGAVAVKRYFKLSREAALYVGECFKIAFPDYYQKYRAAFAAGVWLSEDPGPWLGRAIVWKLDVQLHQDGLDEGPAAIFNFGDFTGGELYLPDLNLKLRYGPGDVVIFFAGKLYHAVGEWKAKPQAPEATVTPGRVGNVFFFPQRSYDRLEGKPPNWAVDTAGGHRPSLQHLR